MLCLGDVHVIYACSLNLDMFILRRSRFTSCLELLLCFFWKHYKTPNLINQPLLSAAEYHVQLEDFGNYKKSKTEVL